MRITLNQGDLVCLQKNQVKDGNVVSYDGRRWVIKWKSGETTKHYRKELKFLKRP